MTELIFGSLTVGLFACGIPYALLARHVEWKERLTLVIGSLLLITVSWLYWFGDEDMVRGLLSYIPEPVRAWYVWLARL